MHQKPSGGLGLYSAGMFSAIPKPPYWERKISSCQEIPDKNYFLILFKPDTECHPIIRTSVYK